MTTTSCKEDAFQNLDGVRKSTLIETCGTGVEGKLQKHEEMWGSREMALLVVK